MNTQDRFDEVRRFCETNANAALAEKYRKYFVEGYDAYGIPLELTYAQRDHWLQQWQSIGVDGFLRLGDRLVATGKYEEGTFAILFMAALKSSFSAALLPKLGCWLDRGLRNWAHVDVFSGDVLSPFLTGKIAPLDAFATWRASDSKWKRRALPVTLIKPAKADALPIKRLLAFLDPMMEDEEKVVRQGLGWCLREAWKKQPDLVEGFLLGWKDSCGRLIIQYATEKMTPAKKARFKATRHTRR
jgi:hypothetical protein